MKNFIKLTFILLAVALFSLPVAAAVGINPLIVTSATALVSLVIPSISGVAFAGLNSEIWLQEIQEPFEPGDSWLSELWDLSAFVENDILNLAQAGADPAVLINNTTYPIDVVERADGNKVMELDRFDTVNTPIQHADQVELSYSKLESVTRGHKRQLKVGFMQKGAHAIAPASNTAGTPVLLTTGTDNGTSHKRMLYADVLRAQTYCLNNDIPQDKLILLLTAQHREDLLLEDQTKYDKMMSTNMLCGFKLYPQADKHLPFYIKSIGAKAAFGATFVGATHARASVFFNAYDVARSVGTDEMYHSEAKSDPTMRRDVIGFSRRGLVIPTRAIGCGAIYSPATA